MVNSIIMMLDRLEFIYDTYKKVCAFVYTMNKSF